MLSKKRDELCLVVMRSENYPETKVVSEKRRGLLL